MKRLKIIIVVFLLIAISKLTFAQDTTNKEIDNYIFWQKDKTITQKDFIGRGELIENAEKYCYQFGLCTKANVSLFAIMDIPKKKKKRGELLEKTYFLTVFDKSKSCILKYDTTGVKYQQVVFDIYEVSTRFARQRIANFQDSIKLYGVATAMFYDIVAKAENMRASLVDSYYQDVIIDKKPDAYNKWRKKIDNMLEESSKYTSKKDDIERFITKTPLDTEYIEFKPKVDD